MAGKLKQIPKINQYYFFKERTMGRRTNGKRFGQILESDEKFMEVWTPANKYFGEYVNCKKTLTTYVQKAHYVITSYSRLFEGFALPSMFNLGAARTVVQKYNLNGRVFDFACGWGQRLLGTLCNKVDYFGCDTNPVLCENLRECARDFISTTGITNTATILNQQSEIPIPEYNNTMGLCFSSPPYFNVELYQGEKTSTTLYGEYDLWLDKYMRQTLVNCYGYLVDGGYMAVNTKNLGKRRPLYQDVMKILGDELHMEFVGEEDYRVKPRCSSAWQKSKGNDYEHERIMVYKKVSKGYNCLEDCNENPDPTRDSGDCLRDIQGSDL